MVKFIGDINDAKNRATNAGEVVSTEGDIQSNDARQIIRSGQVIVTQEQAAKAAAYGWMKIGDYAEGYVIIERK